MEKTVSQQGAYVFRKRKPGKKLTAAENEYNKALTRIRNVSNTRYAGSRRLGCWGIGTATHGENMQSYMT